MGRKSQLMISIHDFFLMQWDNRDVSPLSTTYTCKLCDHQTRHADMMALHLAEHALRQAYGVSGIES